MNTPEYALHCAVADYLRAVLPPEVLWSTFPAGGGGKVRGAKLKRAGLRAGISDLFIAWIGDNWGETRMLWIELKSSKGRESSEQMLFRAQAERIGHYARVARSLSDVERILREYGIPTRGKIAA